MTDVLDQAKQHFLEGVRLFETGQVESAELSFEAALALAPERTSVLTNLGAARVKLGKPAQALALLQKALVAEPGNLQAWSYLALAHAQQGEHSLAVPCYDQALAIDGTRAVLCLQRGQSLARLSRHREALEAFALSTRLEPTLAEAWSHQGTLLREMGHLPEAAACFEKALALGADAQVHQYFLASVRGTDAPGTPPAAYIEFFFNDYAAEFDKHLVTQLRYQGHRTLVEQLRALPGDVGQRRWQAVLDLGCGTGLCGPLIKPHAARLEGIDLSAAMLEQARRLAVYDHLTHADLADYLPTLGRAYDLVLAADVFIYVGDLAPLFAQVSRCLHLGGVFCFTLELASGVQDFELLPSLRYAHSLPYIETLAQRCGFELLAALRLPLREEQRQPVAGLYVYLRLQ
ncbi:MAG: tetratricopeptide repeat protein [Burkholderiaceae bacterium]